MQADNTVINRIRRRRILKTRRNPSDIFPGFSVSDICTLHFNLQGSMVEYYINLHLRRCTERKVNLHFYERSSMAEAYSQRAGAFENGG